MSASTPSLPSPDDSAPQRLFFALWPGSALRGRIARHQALWQASTVARATPAPKLHLTVLFMEGVAAHRVSELMEVGDAISPDWTDFDLTLDRACVWPRGGIAHLAPSQPPAELLRLRAQLVAQVDRRGLPFDGRAFAPHVTLARRAQASQPPTEFPPLHWRVRGFALVRSVLGAGRYEVLGQWPSSGR